MENNEYQADNCYNLMCSVISSCFTESKTRVKREEVKKTRTKFASSNLLQVFCDCSDSFEAGKLKKQILEYLEKDFIKNENKRSIYNNVITKATKGKIKNLRKRGYTYELIGKKYNCSTRTARAIALGINNN